MSNDENSKEAVWIVDGRLAWGKSSIGMSDALENMVEHFRGHFKETEEIQIHRVRGFNGMNGVNIDADEWIQDVEIREVDGKHLEKIRHHLGEAEIAAEQTIEGSRKIND